MPLKREHGVDEASIMEDGAWRRRAGRRGHTLSAVSQSRLEAGGAGVGEPQPCLFGKVEWHGAGFEPAKRCETGQWLLAVVSHGLQRLCSGLQRPVTNCTYSGCLYLRGPDETTAQAKMAPVDT